MKSEIVFVEKKEEKQNNGAMVNCDVLFRRLRLISAATLTARLFPFAYTSVYCY
jgi:hypothetical protein